MKSSDSPAYVVRLTAVGIASIGAKSSNDHLLPTMPVMNNPALFGAAQRVFQCRCSHQFKHLVDPFRKYFPDLFDDRSSINEHVIGAAGTQQLIAAGIASRR